MKMLIHRDKTRPQRVTASYCGVYAGGRSKEEAIKSLTVKLDEINSRWFTGKVVDIEEITNG